MHKRSRSQERLPGAMLHSSDAVQYHFHEETVKTSLPFPAICLYVFFFAATDPPVGAHVNGFGTHALHEDANEYMACVNKHS